MSLSPAFLDELRSRTGLVALVGRRVKLTRAGREWKGCCPFHNEKTPSFYVNEEKGFYHCFGCGAHGDCIRFLMEQDGLPFLDAVRQLAAEAGLAVPEPDAPGPAAERSRTLRDLLAAAERWYAGELHGRAVAEARAYLERRGVTPATAERFGLGFAPEGRSPLSDALSRAFPGLEAETLQAAGLTGMNDSGRRYDRFRGRLMFPIHDPRGRNAGFGGRSLGAAEPKYLNSPEGPLFAKGHLLYNLHRAAPAARKSGRLLVVEGYMDVIGLAGAGIAEAAAPLGTALTAEQMTLAWKLVDEPLLAFDGDAAGGRAGHRAALLALPLLSPGKSLRFVRLADGQDPDDLARSGGAPAVEALIERALPLDRFLFEAEMAAGETDTPERRAALRARLMEVAGTIADPGLRHDYRRSWAQRFDEMAAPVRVGRPGAARPSPFPGRWAPGPPPLRRETAIAGAGDDRILAMLLASFAGRPDAAVRHGEALAALAVENRALAALRDALLDGRSADGLASGVRPLWRAGLSDDEFDRRAGDALASLIELHHIQVEIQQPLPAALGDEQRAREMERRGLLGRARAAAIERLVAHAVSDDGG